MRSIREFNCLFRQQAIIFSTLDCIYNWWLKKVRIPFVKKSIINFKKAILYRYSYLNEE